LRLRPEFALPPYAPASDVPGRLYFGLKPKNMVHTQNIGLISTRRPFVAVCGEPELALRIARRDEKTPLPIEILAREACQSGVSFLAAGPHLYLVQFIPARFIIFPKVRRDLAERLAAPARKAEVQPSPHTAPGSFIVETRHLEGPGAVKPTKKGAKKDPKGGWKKEGRKERHKRDM
jgi:hypothetical protein